MRHLKEIDNPTSPIEAEATDLLRSARVYEPALGQKQRVRARLLQQGSTRRVMLLRPAVGLVVLLCAGGAGAAVGRHWLVNTFQSLVSPSEHGVDRASQNFVRPASKKGLHAPAATVTPATNPEATPVAATRLIVGQPAARGSGAETAGPRPDLSRANHPRTARPADDTGLVFEAMRALRREGQPAQAASLLDEYLRRHPNGSMAEEALALSIEAASARGDARAKDLVTQYFARYPNGHFRGVVEAARARLSL